MMSTPFRQQIDKEKGMLRVIETRHGLATHYDVIRVALVPTRSVDTIGVRAGACGRLRNNHDFTCPLGGFVARARRRLTVGVARFPDTVRGGLLNRVLEARDAAPLGRFDYLPV